MFVNGIKVLTMLPYCEYETGITEIVKAKGNEIIVEIEDISPEFGPSEGWENYGGIIRDVYLVYREENYITDVRLLAVTVIFRRVLSINIETQQ